MNLVMGTIGFVALLILMWAGLVDAVGSFKLGRSYRASVVAMRTVRVLDPQTHARLTELAGQGNKTQAIKDLRVATGLGLKVAEEVVDDLARGLMPRGDVPARTEERARELFAQGRGIEAINLAGSSGAFREMRSSATTCLGIGG